MVKKSKYRCVFWVKSRGKWAVHIMHNYKRIYVGYYNDEEIAFKAFCDKYKEIHKREYIHYGPIVNTTDKTVKIPLSINRSNKVNGYYWVTVDLEDYDLVMQHKWHWHAGYAYANSKGLHETKRIQMHRLIMNFPNTNIDHIDGDGLNNTKANLRLATKQQNQMNQPKRVNCSSIYKGVTYCKREKLYFAYITVKGVMHRLGYFKNENDAGIAYNKAAIEKHGEFARLNTIQNV